jgi:hypothetical protein
MDIAAHVLTCPERAAVLRNTLAGLRASDWGVEPVVVENRDSHPNRKIRIQRGTRTLLEHAGEGGADFILYLEDDLAFNRHLRANLGRWAPLQATVAGQPFFASLFRPPGVPLLREDAANHLALLPAHETFGNLALILSRATVRYALEHWDEEVAEADHKLARLAGRLGPLYLHTPSLVQPLGGKSTWSGPFVQAADFAPRWTQGEDERGPLTPETARAAMQSFVEDMPPCPGNLTGTGVVIAAGGLDYLVNAWVAIRQLRRRGCRLPVQVWHLGPAEMPPLLARLLEAEDVACVDAHTLLPRHPVRQLGGWALKAYALLHAPFRHVLLLDADNVPTVDPSFLFDSAPYQATGAIFWPDRPEGVGLPGSVLRANHPIWRLCDLSYRGDPSFESGQICVDRLRCWRPLQLALWMNEHADFWYQFIYGDKDTFQIAWRALDAPWAMPAARPLMADPRVFSQLDFEGRVIFQHRFGDKWRLDGSNARIPSFAHEEECRQAIDELKQPLFADLGVGRDRVPRLASGQWLWSRQGRPPRVLSFQPDGSVGASSEKAARLWRMSGGELLLLGDDLAVSGQFRYVARAEAWLGRGETGSSLVRVGANAGRG